MRKTGIVIVLAALALPAMAQDVRWFDAHPADRKAQLDACRRDRQIGMLPVCDNAQTSETNDVIRRMRGSEGASPQAPDARWFATHPAARQAQLEACRRTWTMPACGSAQAAEAVEARRRQAGTGPVPGVNLPWEPSPLLRDTMRSQCQRPPQYRLFPEACGS